MRALVNRGEGGTEVGFEEVAEPEPAPDEVVIEVRAVSVNRGELRLLAVRPAGWRPGQDVAGVVVRAAADGSGPPEDTRVVAWVDQAGWAERTAAATDRVAVLADHVPFAEGATLPVAGMTALRALREGGDLLGRRVLVTGAAGGVGRLAVELAARGGAWVAGVVGGPDRAEGLSELGADETVTDIEELEGPFDLILESVGGRSLERATELVAHSGTVVIFGSSSGKPGQIGFGDFSQRPARLQIFFVYQSGLPFGPDLQRLADMVAADRLHPQVGLEVGWEEAEVAFRALADRQVNGKAVLRVG